MYVCVWLPSEPTSDAVKVVCVEPSPQFTSTDQSASGPGSLKEPSEKEWLSPSFELWSAAEVTLGATLATWTIWIVSDSLSLAWSESSTFTCTFVVGGTVREGAVEGAAGGISRERVGVDAAAGAAVEGEDAEVVDARIGDREGVRVRRPLVDERVVVVCEGDGGRHVVDRDPVAVGVIPPSPSSTETLTSEPDATGPSSKTHLKLDAVFEPATYAPGPQSTVIVSVSSSASLVVKLNVRSAVPDSLYV